MACCAYSPFCAFIGTVRIGIPPLQVAAHFHFLDSIIDIVIKLYKSGFKIKPHVKKTGTNKSCKCNISKLDM